MKYLISIAIGPVQDFIAAARRSRDLWFGSYLLSEISKAAARALHSNGAQLLFPFADNLDTHLVAGSDFTAVNKILALADHPWQLCEQAKEAAQKVWADAREQAIQGTQGKVQVDRELMSSQANSMLEFHAVWVPYHPVQHQVSRERVELLLAARKAFRDFGQYNLGSDRPKSSLDGFRETVLLDKGRSTRLFESHLKRNERLDAVGVIKRFGKPFGQLSMPDFDSTIDVAGKPYVNRIQNSGEFDRYWAFVSRHVGYKTCALLYDHDSRQLFDEEPEDLSPEDQETLKELAKIRKDIYDKHGRPNPPYYALLVGDGDFMGRAIGKFTAPSQNQDFSRELSRFAQVARDIVNDHQGCPIYTGGDDVMALLPLHTLLDCVQKVRQQFIQLLKEYSISFSAGVVIAHALEPLSEVLRMARDTEGRAKRVSGKDAIALTVCPRSGADVEIEGKWETLVPLLRDIVESYHSKKLSLGFAHELSELYRRTPPQLDSILKELASAAAGKKQENEKAMDLVERHVQDRKTLSCLFQAMLVARPIYRAVRESHPQQEVHSGKELEK
jgi:CRISPR-associated protein Cmr2